MAHTHPVIDGDNHFIIDPITRAVTNAESKKTILMQNDHNSERFTFEIDKTVEGHDMTKCNKVEIHYTNEDSNKKNKNAGVYEVSDMQVSEDNSDKLIFSWLVSENATLYAGSLKFLIVFSCVEKGEVTYRWNTNVNTSISISKGMNNGEALEGSYPDVLTKWKEDIFAAMRGMETTYVGPTEPETYPYIWFDTSQYIGETDPYIGIIRIKDAEGNEFPLYPFTKLSATDGVDLGKKFDELIKKALTTDNIANDLTTEDVGKVLDARQGKVLDDKIKNAAPAGYGLGVESIYASDANTCTGSGWYIIDSATANKPEHLQYGIIFVKRRNYLEIVQEVVEVTRGYKAQRYSLNGVWEPWAYVNPPMELGVEYRTTEHHDRKVVYKKNIDGVINYRLDGETTWKPYAKAVGSATAIQTSVVFWNTNWSSTAPYTQTVTVPGVLATDMPIIDGGALDGDDDSTAFARIEAWNCVQRIVATDNALTAYCYEEKPVINFGVRVVVVR